MRTSVMLIGDGVTPGNEGRGYVLRRIMRRAIRNMRLLGATGPVVKNLVDTVIAMMGQQYPELVTDRERIEKVAVAEENAFLKTLKAGTNILTPPSPRPSSPAAASCPARRPFCSTTPGASRSTSPWRWPPNRASPWTRRASAA